MYGVPVLEYCSFDMKDLTKKQKIPFSLLSEKIRNRKLIKTFQFFCLFYFLWFMEPHSDLYIPIRWQLVCSFLSLFIQRFHLAIHQTQAPACLVSAGTVPWGPGLWPEPIDTAFALERPPLTVLSELDRLYRGLDNVFFQNHTISTRDTLAKHF